MDKQIEQIKEDIDIYADLDIFLRSKGGEQIVKGIFKDITASIETLASKHSTLTMQEFVSISAQIKERLDFVRVLTRAEKNKRFLTEELKKMLEESIRE